MDPKDHGIEGGGPEQPQMDRAMGPHYRPFAPRPAIASAPIAERRTGDRRQAERRNFLSLGGRRHDLSLIHI